MRLTQKEIEEREALYAMPKLTRDQARLVNELIETHFAFRFCTTAAQIREKKARLVTLRKMLGLCA